MFHVISCSGVVRRQGVSPIVLVAALMILGVMCMAVSAVDRCQRCIADSECEGSLECVAQTDGMRFCQFSSDPPGFCGAFCCTACDCSFNSVCVQNLGESCSNNCNCVGRLLCSAGTCVSPTAVSPTPEPVCIDAEWMEERGLAKIHSSDGVGELLCIVGLHELPCGTPDHVLEVTVPDAQARMRSGGTVMRTYAEVCSERACTSKTGRFNGVLHSDARKLPSQEGMRLTSVSHRGTAWSSVENRIVLAAQSLRSSKIDSVLAYLQRRNSA